MDANRPNVDQPSREFSGLVARIVRRAVRTKPSSAPFAQRLNERFQNLLRQREGDRDEACELLTNELAVRLCAAMLPVRATVAIAGPAATQVMFD
jgi:hypothetical protein